ncbi:uncharacterized protein LOC131251750 [Magnolia sinica]|uniref:uncharacterized protein LOC131251750 n=1 Tax=Magnolia sinica TaxID=86752 RepID=UPI00265B1C8E|nr:uncharacterized protein LOC131251750 [Magnolia sinica]XP_058108666.1 uncharacterized protein LOC131251750 [Magnolia sinica]XP_058108667.1 uncharacterized protein LOC131251750 [Magnolia sinica]
MMRSAIRLSSNSSRRIFPSHPIHRFFSTETVTQPQSPFPPRQNPFQHQEETVAAAPPGKEEHTHQQPRNARRVVGGDYQSEQARVLQAALRHVVKLGWGEAALISGARDVGLSPSVVGSFARKEAALIEYFMDDCLQKLIDRIDEEEDLTNLILSKRLAKLIRIRLEMQAPYISKWPQALSIQAQPPNITTSFKQRAMLVDEIWHAAGDHASDIDWYVKRTVLGGIYSTSEVYMVTDHSPEFRDTWSFLDRRIKDAFDLQKTIQEATYLAEAVGAGMGSSLQGFMKRVFQG